MIIRYIRLLGLDSVECLIAHREFIGQEWIAFLSTYPVKVYLRIRENIIPNVKPNSRNSNNQEKEPYQNGTHIFDDELYKDRSVIEHSNSWIDGFKALLVRFEFLAKNWLSLHFMAFLVIFVRKINKKIKV